MVAVHAAIDANKSGGIPLGGWTSFENDTAPNDEWIQAGTTFDSDTYPELFLYLGGNTVPERYDHNRPGDYELGTITTSNTVVDHDCFITLKARHTSGTTGYLYIYVNDISLGESIASGGGQTTVYALVKKGDNIRYGSSNVSDIKAYFEYYTHPMFIKATTTASSYTPSSAVQEIKDYTKDYVDAKNSYSTTETPTGGTWIDGKPIYRRVLEIASISGNTTYEFTHNSDIDTIITNAGVCLISNSKRTFPFIQGQNRVSINEYNSTKLYIASNFNVTDLKLVIEYTKTTD